MCRQVILFLSDYILIQGTSGLSYLASNRTIFALRHKIGPEHRPQTAAKHLQKAIIEMVKKETHLRNPTSEDRRLKTNWHFPKKCLRKIKYLKH